MLAPSDLRRPRRPGRPGRDATSSARMAAEVRAGLSAQPLPWLPCKYFYDDRGSALFEQITRLPEYYQTRTEEGLLERVAGEVVAATTSPATRSRGPSSGRQAVSSGWRGRVLGVRPRPTRDATLRAA